MPRETWKTAQVTIRLKRELKLQAEEMARLLPHMTQNDFYTACIEAVMRQLDGGDDTPSNLVVALRAVREARKRSNR